MRRGTPFEVIYFGTIPIIDTLTNTNKLRKYFETDTKAHDDLWLGYSLLIGLVVDRLIDELLLNPALFGVPRNDLVERAFQGDVPYANFPINSYQGRLVVSLFTLYRPLLSTTTFSDFEKKISPIQTNLLPALKLWSQQFVFYYMANRKRANLKDILRSSAVMFLHLFCHDLTNILIAYNHMFLRSRQYLPQYYNLPTIISGQKIFEGYKLGITLIWQYLLGSNFIKISSFQELLKTNDWKSFDSLYRNIQNDVVTPMEQKAESVYFAKKKTYNRRFIHQLTKAVHPNLAKKNSLNNKFLHYEVRIVSEESTGRTTNGFMVGIRGAISFLSGKVKVIRFIHPEHHARNSYSYAFLISPPNIIWNYSEWWLFYNFCDNYSNLGISAYKPIERFLKQHSSRLQVTSVKISARELIDYVHAFPEQAHGVPDPLKEHLEEETLSGLRRQLERSKEITSDMKGLTLELLTLNVITRMGFDTRWRFQKVIGNELDILAFRKHGKSCEFLVIECSTNYNDDLLEEIIEKVNLVEQKAVQLTVEFTSEHVNTKKVNGWLITTDALDPKMIRKQGKVTILDRNDIKSKCESYGMGWPESLNFMYPLKEYTPIINIKTIDDFHKLFRKIRFDSINNSNRET